MLHGVAPPDVDDRRDTAAPLGFVQGVANSFAHLDGAQFAAPLHDDQMAHFLAVPCQPQIAFDNRTSNRTFFRTKLKGHLLLSTGKQAFFAFLDNRH
jgi:hypothetical protein